MRRRAGVIVLAAALVAGCGASTTGRHRHAPAPAGGPTAIAGAPGPPAGCSTTLSPGADIQAALAAAHPGDVVCLSAGAYGSVELTGISPAGNITLAPVPGAAAHLTSLTFVGPATSANLTVQGLYIDSGVAVRTGTPGGLVFRYDTIENVPRGYAFYFYAAGSSPGHYTQSGVEMLNNQIDHVGACLEIDGGGQMAQHFTFSDNVCGPGIGAGAIEASGASHYIQAGGITGLTADHNAFLGPMDPSYQRAGLHNNVLHTFGDSSDIEFSHNLMWHTQSRGQTILLEQGRLDDVRITDNLDVEDPACDVRGQCAGYAMYVVDARGLSVTENTVVDSYWGVLLTLAGQGAYPTGSGYDIARNVAVGTKGNPGLSLGRCTSECRTGHNVTDDSSASRAGTPALGRWRPRWTTTAWTPQTPYARPPRGFWRAAGLPWAAGYKGAVGP
jgi:hypothetical protein